MPTTSTPVMKLRWASNCGCNPAASLIFFVSMLSLTKLCTNKSSVYFVLRVLSMHVNRRQQNAVGHVLGGSGERNVFSTVRESPQFRHQSACGKT